MIALECNVVGVEKVQARLLGLPPALRAKLVEAMLASVIEVGAAARAAAPRGTGKTAGRLQNSIATSVKETRDAVVGRVYARDYVGRFMEGGVHAASEQVRSYVRHDGGGQFISGGYRLRSRGGDVRAIGKRGQELKRLSHVGVTVVKAYTRSVHIEPHPFMRPAYERNRSAIEARIAAAVEAACAEADG